MIRFEQFVKTFGRHPAVRGFSLEVQPGEVVALLGPNGSGKTTCLKAAAGLLRPTSGAVLLGSPPRPSWVPSSRSTLSFLPQRVVFPEHLTGLEVVDFYRRLRGVEAWRATEALAFARLEDASWRATGTYSGGMLQRLGLAVAALADAPLLLLDEPTAALDPDGLRTFYDLVEAQRRGGRTVLFTTHHLDDVQELADRFALLVDGRLGAVMSAEELDDRLTAPGEGHPGIRRRLEGLYRELAGLRPQ